MKKYNVTIYPVTPWVVTVEAESEEEAQKIALGLDGPACYIINDDEWKHDILEWPNIGNRTVDIEEL